MPREFVLHIEGEVGGKGRPRTRIVYQNGRPIAVIYPDPDSAKTEKLIKGLAYAHMGGRPLFDCPVELTIEIFRQHPPSWTRKMRECAAGFYCTGKPDVDNVVKLIGDAFNETVWTDDKLVADLVVRRRFGDFAPSVVVTVKELVLPATGADLLDGLQAG